jgi:hypothetical protein
MKINTPLTFGVGFPSGGATLLRESLNQMKQHFSSRKYSEEIEEMSVWLALEKLRYQVQLPKPHIKKSKTYKAADDAGWPKDWPDQHVPEHLELQTYVDFDTAAKATGSELRHALVDPICVTLLQTPKTIQQRIRIQDLIMDLQIWADLSD